MNYSIIFTEISFSPETSILNIKEKMEKVKSPFCKFRSQLYLHHKILVLNSFERSWTKKELSEFSSQKTNKQNKCITVVMFRDVTEICLPPRNFEFCYK